MGCKKQGAKNTYFQNNNSGYIFMPFSFTGRKMFCASPNILGQTKN